MTFQKYQLALAVAAVGVAFQIGGQAKATVIYDNTQNPLPGNVPSLGYEATSTSEFGNAITFGGTDRSLTDINIVMSDWANQSDYPGVGDANGYDQTLTFNLYNAGPSNTVGSLIASKTETVHVPWHTVNGFNGTAFSADFDFTGVTVPDSVIFGLAYNTQNYGANPTGASGPYNSLNFGLAQVDPTVGSNVTDGTAYWNTSGAGFYADGGAGGVGTFRQDTNWSPYSAMIQVNAVPEPASIGLLGLGGLSLLKRRRRIA